jgi:hypothetical protein
LGFDADQRIEAHAQAIVEKVIAYSPHVYQTRSSLQKAAAGRDWLKGDVEHLDEIVTGSNGDNAKGASNIIPCSLHEAVHHLMNHAVTTHGNDRFMALLHCLACQVCALSGPGGTHKVKVSAQMAQSTFDGGQMLRPRPPTSGRVGDDLHL